MNREAGQSVIEILVAVFIIALIALGILGLSILTTRLLVGAERHVTALAIVNEYKEFIESLPYGDVGFVSPGVGEPAGVIAGSVETVVRNDQTYQLTVAIQYVDDPLTAEADDYKKVDLRVEWTTASGATRDAQVVTYLSEKSEPKSCVSCPDGRSCDVTTGVCDPPASPEPSPSGDPCAPGSLCGNGTLCTLAGRCSDDGTPVPLTDPQGEACVLGGTCTNGALCPLSGVCPTASCPDWTCPAGNTCFAGFCYEQDWYNLTFSPYDQSGPADTSPMLCKEDQCETSLDCPGNCQSDCQYINSGTFSGCGRWRVVRQCQTTWVPQCRAATAGGAVGACRGGYDPGGNCSGLECQPEACLVSGECANGQECESTSSNSACGDDTDCPVGEMCAPSGSCRTICADDASCNYYWGGWTKGCVVEVVVEGPAGCSEVDGSCVGSTGSCTFDGTPTVITVNIDNVDPGDYGTVLADPIQITEQNVPTTTEVAFRVTLSDDVVDTLTVRVELQDGTASKTGEDYTGNDTTLTFEPGEALSQVVLAQVVGDSAVEPKEDFAAVIVQAVSQAHDVQVSDSSATVNILNDDAAPSSSPTPPV